MKRSILVAILFSGTTWLVTAANAPRLEVKHKSSFTMEGNHRNPFWPIGWKPAVVQTTESQAEAEVPPSSFLVSSITMQAGARFAIINGKIMQEGQIFGLKLGNQIYRVTVEAIQDGKVILTQHGRQIVVPMTRK